MKQRSLISCRQQVSARPLTKCFQSTESIWVDVSANEILHLARYTEGVDCLRKWTHLASGVGTDFKVYILLKTC